MDRLYTDTLELPALPLEACFAKTYVSVNGTIELGRTVFEHCCIVGEIARKLVSLYPVFLQKEYFPKGTALAVGVHDIGKVSPSMQEKLRRAMSSYQNHSLPELSHKGIADPNSPGTHHAVISEAALHAVYSHGYLSEIAGKHHGYANTDIARASAEKYGGATWQAMRIELLKRLEAHFNEHYPLIDDRVKADVLSGLTSVSDWIGSGLFFESPGDSWEDKIDKAVVSAGFVKPKIKAGLSFKDIFNYDPYLMQGKLADVCQKPGVYVLEAPMGLGKTEAALYAGYRMLETGQATGIYFALPTQLTSNKIHERFSPFLSAILETDSPHLTPLLLHGNAQLQHSEMGEDASPGQAWFCSLKRAILAPFGVGTIDQALFSALPDVKHSFVRTFGLLGKVVILDEIHTYDTYTGVILDSLIEQLRRLSCTVIILSATITRNRRKLILGTFPHKDDYPLISTLAPSGAVQEFAVEALHDRCVHLHMCEESNDALREAVARAESGQQVLWIENTVAEAQEVYKLIKASGAHVESGLVHSRFMQNDREKNEARWIHYFGKEGARCRYEQGRILIGTQVLEQSLDIDADFLVCQLCPTDMFLQRLGRLWRHNLTNRHPDAKPDVFLIAPAALSQPSQDSFGRSGKVYAPYILYRSLEVLRGYKDIFLPSNIRTILESTYMDREEQGGLAWLKGKFVQQAESFSRMAAVAMSKMGQKVRDVSPSTRYSEIDTCSVLLAKSIAETSQGVSVVFLDGAKVVFPRNVKAYDKKQWRKLAILLRQNIVNVATYHAPKPCVASWLNNWLKEYVYMGDDNLAFRVALVGDAGELYSLDNSAANMTYTITYTSHMGYELKKTKEAVQE